MSMSEETLAALRERANRIADPAYSSATEDIQTAILQAMVDAWNAGYEDCESGYEREGGW